MDLSGQYIKGTGSFEVKEIAPAVEIGQILANHNFATGDFTGWSTADSNWSVVPNPRGGFYAYADHSIGAGNISQPTALTIGRFYKFTLKLWDSNNLGDIYYYNIGASSTLITNMSNGEYEFIGEAVGTAFTLRAASDMTGYFEVSVEEISEGYPLMKPSETYFECTSSGTLAFPSKQAYGEWEFDLYKGGDGNASYVFPMTNIVGAYTDAGVNGYMLYLGSSEEINLSRASGSGVLVLLTQSSFPLIDWDVWYRIKLTRTLDGEWYTYIRGGAFGDDDWTLVTAASGSNPATDNVYKASQYFVLDFSLGDRITNIITRKSVEQ